MLILIVTAGWLAVTQIVFANNYREKEVTVSASADFVVNHHRYFQYLIFLDSIHSAPFQRFLIKSSPEKAVDQLRLSESCRNWTLLVCNKFLEISFRTNCFVKSKFLLKIKIKQFYRLKCLWHLLKHFPNWIGFWQRHSVSSERRERITLPVNS